MLGRNVKVLEQLSKAYVNPMTICLQECYKGLKYLKGFGVENGSGDLSLISTHRKTVVKLFFMEHH